MTSPPDRMRPIIAAAYLGIAGSTLAKMRLRGDGPPYSKIGPRAIVYLKDDLDHYFRERQRRSTSENDHQIR
ncbi:MAG: helix-turn-helix domain-containing protein [Chloroflexia bacterium]